MAQEGMWWLRRGCGGSGEDVVAQKRMWSGDVMAQEEMWWIKRGCGGSVRDVVAQERMWWLNQRCCGSIKDVVGGSGENVVGQEGMC